MLTWQTDVEWRHVDLYGRRPLVRHGLVGPYSTRTNLTATLPVDFSFKVRRARRTLWKRFCGIHCMQGGRLSDT